MPVGSISSSADTVGVAGALAPQSCGNVGCFRNGVACCLLRVDLLKGIAVHILNAEIPPYRPFLTLRDPSRLPSCLPVINYRVPVVETREEVLENCK